MDSLGDPDTPKGDLRPAWLIVSVVVLAVWTAVYLLASVLDDLAVPGAQPAVAASAPEG